MIDWIDEGYDGLDSDDDRTIALHHCDMQIGVPAAAAWATGPLTRDEPDEPPDPEIPHWPHVTSGDVNVIKTPIEDPLPKDDGGE
jgi:hypothetical protein